MGDLREALDLSYSDGPSEPCPSCGGSGWNLTDELVEVAAKTLETEAKKNPVESSYMPGMSSRIMSQPIEDVARAVLVAVFDYLKENQPKATHTNYNTGEQCFCDQKEQQ